MKLEDLKFEKVKYYDMYNSEVDKDGFVSEWVARNEWGNAVAFGDTKKECIEEARRYIKKENELAKKEGSKTLDETIKNVIDKKEEQKFEISVLSKLYKNMVKYFTSNSREDIMNVIEKEKESFGIKTIKKTGEGEYLMENENRSFAVSWPDGYSHKKMAEDMTRCAQVMKGIEIEGVHDTSSLIKKLEENKRSLRTKNGLAKE